MKAVPEFQGVLLLWEIAVLGEKTMIFQTNSQPRKVCCSVVATLRCICFAFWLVLLALK